MQGALQRAGQVHVWRVRHVLAVTQVMQLQQAKKRAQLEMPLSMRAGAARAEVARARARSGSITCQLRRATLRAFSAGAAS